MLALAPMQDVTDLGFWRLLCRYQGPDLYFTEYFRVYPGSRPDPGILRSIVENPTGCPVVAQMIGNDVPELIRTAQELQEHPVAAIDLNLGCPAPVVYRKCAGGGLLREPDRVDAILGALRAAVRIPFTVKTRLGFDSAAGFDRLLAILGRHSPDLVTVHGRTVREMYRSEVHYDLIARAVDHLPCPVLANGNVYSAQQGLAVLNRTGARGLMVGRGAIRNPWIFRQFRELTGGNVPWLPTGRDVLAYLERLFEATWVEGLVEAAHVQRIKKHLNYVGLGIEPTGRFLHEVRRVRTSADLFRLWREYLEHDRPMSLEPFDLPLRETDVLAGCHR